MSNEHPCDVDEIRTLFLFEKLNEDQLGRLCRLGHVETVEPGWVLREGEPALWFYVLLEGSVALFRRVGTDDVEITRTDNRGVYGGAFQAYLGDRIRQVYNNSLRANVRSRFFVLAAEDFAQLMREWFPMALHLLEGLFFGTQSAQQALQQRERLLALGSLSAGLTHELNNPAAAAVRATSSLRDRLADMRHELSTIASGLDQRHVGVAGALGSGGRRGREDGTAIESDGDVGPRGPSRRMVRGPSCRRWLELGGRVRPGRTRGALPGASGRSRRRSQPRERRTVAHLCPRGRDLDGRDLGFDNACVDVDRCGQAVLTDGPCALPGHRSA